MNGDVSVKEVVSKADLKKFIGFPNKLYKNNKFYIPNLEKAESDTLSKDQNPAFEFCTSKYWLALKGDKVVGRIAGIINTRYNEERQIRYARFGWFDFVDDQDVVDALLRIVENWAAAQGMEYVHGPLGFCSFDSSGVLIEGFEEMPTAFSHYNFDYYATLIENAGYLKDIDWVEYKVKVPDHVPEKVTQFTELVKKRYGLKSAALHKKTDILQYSDQIFDLLNKEYSSIYAFSKLSRKQIKKLNQQFINLLQPEYVSIILDKDDQVVAFGITMPSIARALQKSGGRLWLFAIYKILGLYMKTTTVDALLIAVKKDFQSKGITGLIFNDIIPELIKKGFVNFESTKEMEQNTKVSNLWHTYEHRQHKRTRCYIKQLSTTG